MMLTLNEVKEHLRYDIDDNSNDLVLTSYILGAESAIKNFIDKDVDINTKADIKIAAMLLIGFFDLYRNAEISTLKNANYLPYPVLMLLTQYRRPTIV